MADRVRGYRHVKEEIEGDTRERYNLYLNSRDQTFLAKWSNRTITGQTGREVKKAMEKLIREENKLEFFPVIVVKERPPFASQVPFIAFTQERTYVAHRSGPRLAQIRWEHYRGASDLQQYKNTLIGAPGDFRFMFEALPFVYQGDGENTYILHYSEDLWTGLIALGKLVKKMQVQFRDLLSTDVGIQRIEQAGASALLPSGLEDSAK